MSELARNDVSTESLCTVIENCTGNNRTNCSTSPTLSINTHTDISFQPDHNQEQQEVNETRTANTCNVTFKENDIYLANTYGIAQQSAIVHNDPSSSVYETCDTSQEESNSTTQADSTTKTRSKLKKSVSFDPQDEKVRKFITGEPIVDQQNPFKQHYSSLGNSSRKKKTPPPVPTKRSTLSVRKTVTQQLREREREKEKERERLKNEANNRKSCNSNGNSNLTSPDDFITTEEVLKQSKYVKTYIKNPDPYFVYDPTILARIKFEELRELADKKPPKKLRLSPQTKERIKELKNKNDPLTYSKLPFKKCSKPNYPELADIKVKVGTDLDGSLFNPAEVSKNAKKFDDRVKKLHIGSDDDLDEIDGPLTKSESSDEVTANNNNNNNNRDSTDKEDEDILECEVMNGENSTKQPTEGTFTNTIKSKEFQEYLDKKGLTLIPKKIPNGARSVYVNGNSVATPKSSAHITFKTPESVQISVDTMDAARNNNNNKKPSVFQRLLANSIFATRRKTTPKDAVPTPRTLYEPKAKTRENGNIKSPTAIKRVILERQSFHGRSRPNNLLTPAETSYLKQQTERSRRSYASGDNLSVSLSSVLTNAEYANLPEQSEPKSATAVGRVGIPTPIAKPPRRTLSRERLSGSIQPSKQQPNTVIKPKVQRSQIPNGVALTLPAEQSDIPSESSNFKRNVERQSFIPKRTTQTPDRRQVFGRSTSMDRNEILRKRLMREQQTNKSKSDNETSKLPTPLQSKENLREHFSSLNGPKLTSTPLKNADTAANESVEGKGFAPTNKIYVDQQEWERLKAIKERTDQELYYRMLQQQQQQQQQQPTQRYLKPRQDGENIYEHLPAPQLVVLQHDPLVPQLVRQPEGNFVRGSPQRNTFSGVTRNRQAKIIDGRALLPLEYPLTKQYVYGSNHILEPTPRSQSVLDGMTQSQTRIPAQRRDYESDSETTPVVLRRRDTTAQPNEQAEQRRIGGILTREEILQKVKEFCRKSLNKTPTPLQQPPQMQAIYEKRHGSTDLSPVSYASVETQQRPTSRMYAAPQVPQRMQSLPQQFIPIGTHQIVAEPNKPNTASPIYAHVVKRSSLLSNQSELYDSPQKPYLVRRESDAQTIYVSRASLQRPDTVLPATQYVLVDSEKLMPAQLVSYYPTHADIYAQPQYIRPYKLKPMPGTYGYITVRESLPQSQQQQQQQQQQQHQLQLQQHPPLQQQQLRPRLHDGRSTPLILDRSSQQASQIYWTPQHQRLQQHTGLVPVEFSPRYTLKQPHPIPAPRLDLAHRATQKIVPQTANQLLANNTNNSVNVERISTPTLRQQQQQLPHSIKMPNESNNGQHPYEWESGSEAGEVQRIMENSRNNGEFKARNLLRNLKERMSRLISKTKR